MSGLRKKFKRRGGAHIFTALNLTALIDLFTILILFLLFNLAGGGNVLPPTKALQLPISVSEKAPQPTVTIMVTRDEISVEGKKVGDVQDILNSEEIIIPDLQKELSLHAGISKSVGKATGVEVFDGKVTILGDQEIPFLLLEKIMLTCSESEFPDIRLAVLQKETA